MLFPFKYFGANKVYILNVYPKVQMVEHETISDSESPRFSPFFLSAGTLLLEVNNRGK